MSNYNPYTPPVHDGDAGRPLVSGRASWDGTALTVPKQFSFPRMCLKCASPEVHTRRTQNFAFTPMWARLLVLVCWPGALIAMVLTTKRATLEVPLCDPCHARWRKARNAGILLAVGVVVGVVAASFVSGSSGSEAAALIFFAVLLLLVVGVVVGVNQLIRPHLLQAKKIDEDQVTLLGVHPTAGERVAELSRS